MACAAEMLGLLRSKSIVLVTQDPVKSNKSLQKDVLQSRLTQADTFVGNKIIMTHSEPMHFSEIINICITKLMTP